MKKFFTAIPLQQSPEGLNSVAYQAVGNSRLQMESKTSFPILTTVNGYVQPGEEFRLIAVMPDSEATRRNRDTLTAQLEQLCARKGLCCPKGVETVLISGNQEVSAHVETFQKLLDYVDDDDELFCCMTFGTKPLSHAMLLAVQYAYRIRTNASIECIVYGQVDRTGPRSANKGFVYDMTALVQLDEIVHLLAQQKTADPEAVLRALLEL